MKATKLFPRLDIRFDIPNFRDNVPCRETILREFETKEIKAFLSRHPEYHASDFNMGVIQAWLKVYDVPASTWNLEVAYTDLKEDGLLESAPTKLPTIDDSRGVILQVGDRLAEYRPSDEEVEVLSKLTDDSALTDHQRKNRDEKLRRLAGSQRRAMADPTKPSFHERSVRV